MSDSPTDDLIRRLLGTAAGLARARATTLVDEARAEAEAEVKALVKSAMKAALLRATLEQLSDSAPASDAPMRKTLERDVLKLGKSSAGPASADGKSGGSEMDEEGRAAPLGTLRDGRAARAESSGGEAIYIYGIAPREAELASAAEGVAGAPVEAIVEGELQAIVSRVPLDAFGDSDASATRTAGAASGDDEVKRLEANVLAHDHVLRAAVATGTVLPFRFGTVVRHDDDVRRLLAAHQRQFVDGLASLAGKKEWGVRLSAATAAPVAADDVAATVAPDGRAYLQRKRQRDQSMSAAGRAAGDLVADVHRQLSALAAAVVELPTTGGAADGARSAVTRTINAAYLVADADERRFHELVNSLSAAHAARGLSCRLTGPWPAYNFVRLDLQVGVAA